MEMRLSWEQFKSIPVDEVMNLIRAKNGTPKLRLLDESNPELGWTLA